MPCVAHADGQPCDREPAMTAPVALCDVHRLQVALAVVPEVLRGQLASAAQPVAISQLLQGPHDPIVYFIAHGQRVKIGFTGNLKKRVTALALRPDSILLALDGGLDLERALHVRFDAERVDDTEWFELTPRIRHYIKGREGETPRRVRRAQSDVQRRMVVSGRDSTEAERVALLADLADLIGEAPRMRTRDALRCLAQRSPDVYGDWNFRDLTQVLRAAGAPPYMSNGLATIARQEVLAALEANRSQ